MTRIMALTLFALAVSVLALAASIAMTLSANAQTMTPVDDADGIAVVVENRGTPRTDYARAIETTAGRVIIRYRTTANDRAGCCNDEIEVLEMPPGYVAIPPSVSLPEGDSVRINLLEYLGG